MARVPGPGKRTIFTQIPDVVDTGTGSVFASLAAGLATASKVVAPLASQAAIAAGSEAVTRDALGNLQANTRIPFTEMDQLYNEAAKSIYMTELDGEVASRITALSFEHQDDPAAFQQAARSYMTDLQRSAPPAFRGDVALLAGRRINRVHSTLVGDFYQRQQTRAYNANEAAVDRLAREYSDYAAAPSADNRERMAEVRSDMQALLTARENLPGSRWTAEQTADALDRFDRSAASGANRAIGEMTGAAIDILQAGYVPSNISDVVEAAKGTEFEGELAVQIAAHEMRPDFAKLSPEEQVEFLNGFTKPGLNEDQLAMANAFREIHQKTVDAVMKDPVGHALATSPEAFAGPLDITDPASVQARWSAIQQTIEEGRNPAQYVFSSEEADELSAMLKSKDPAQIAQVINGVASFGAGGASLAAQQLDLDPAQQHLVNLSRFGGSQQAIAKAITGMSVPRPERPDDDYRFRVQQEVLEPYVTASSVFIGDPERSAVYQGEVTRIVATAQAIFAAELQTRGISADDDDAAQVYTEAMQQSLGGSGGNGGLADVNGFNLVVPPTLSGSALRGGFDAWERSLYRTAPDLQQPDNEAAPLATDVPGTVETQRLIASLRNPGALPVQELDNEYTREQVAQHHSEFWQGVSVSGGLPSLDGLEGVSGPAARQRTLGSRDLSGVRIMPISNDRAIMLVRQGGEWAMIRDSQSSELFVFSLSAFARKGVIQ